MYVIMSMGYRRQKNHMHGDGGIFSRSNRKILERIAYQYGTSGIDWYQFNWVYS